MYSTYFRVNVYLFTYFKSSNIFFHDLHRTSVHIWKVLKKIKASRKRPQSLFSFPFPFVAYSVNVEIVLIPPSQISVQ